MEFRIKTGQAIITSILIDQTEDVVSLVLGENKKICDTPQDRCAAVKPELLKDLNHLTWAQIKEISNSGRVCERFALGATKIDHMKNGFDMVWKIIDFYKDVDEQGNLIPITWDASIAYCDEVVMNSKGTNDGGWDMSDGRKYCNEDFFNMCSDELRSIVTPAVKITALRDGTLQKTVDNFWLKSEKELFGRNIWSSSGEGKWYEYYRQENVPYYVVDKNGDRIWAWERSPFCNNAYDFCFVNTNGNADYNCSRYAFGLAPAFCC